MLSVMKPRITLCLMLKAPRPGSVKTRLAQDLGAAEAAAVYREMVEIQLTEVPETWAVEVHFSPANSEAEMRAWLAGLLRRDARFFPQPEGDLGARLSAALSGALARGAGTVLFAGGDCPDLTRARLEEAATFREAEDVVIIPAHDGGYVLIGLRTAHISVFEDIAWSTSAVFVQTLARVVAAGLRHRALPPLEDVDDLESWRRWREQRTQKRP